MPEDYGLLDTAMAGGGSPAFDERERGQLMMQAFTSELSGRDGFREGLQMANQMAAQKKQAFTERDTKGLLGAMMNAAQSGQPIDPRGIQAQFPNASPESVRGVLSTIMQQQNAKQEAAAAQAGLMEQRQYNEGLAARERQNKLTDEEAKANQLRARQEQDALDVQQMRGGIGAAGLLSGIAPNPDQEPPSIDADDRGILSTIVGGGFNPLPPGRAALASQVAREQMAKERAMEAEIARKQQVAVEDTPERVAARERARLAVRNDPELLKGDIARIEAEEKARNKYRAPGQGSGKLFDTGLRDQSTGLPIFRDYNGNLTLGRPAEGVVPAAKVSEGDKKFAEVTADIKGSIDRIRENYSPEYVGPIAGPTSKLVKKVPGMDFSGQQATFMADVLSMSDTELRKRSGAAITPSEWDRLVTFLPNISDKPDVFNAHLDRFEQALNAVIAAREGARLGHMPQQSGGPGSATQAQTKTIGGVTYRKVQGGWEAVQ